MPPILETRVSPRENIVNVLRWRARHQAERPAYTFLSRGEQPVKTYDFATLDCRARAIAAVLIQQCQVQQRALLIYSSGLEFIEAFWACLYARIIAVPAYPPKNNLQGASRLESIIGDCAPELIISTREHLSDLGKGGPTALGKIPWLATDQIADGLAENWEPGPVGGEDIALLQYSSGSTASPRGVIISHANIVANQRMIEESFQHTEASTFVGWLPFFHDMGLFGNIIQPLFIGAHSVLMSPLSFLQKPVRWLKAISDYGGRTSGGPNFGYEYCVRRINEQDKVGLDLSTWEVAFNGAEKPRASTLRSFSEAFRRCGFRPATFYPCYGLAEAVLFVTGRDKTKQPDPVELAAAPSARPTSHGVSVKTMAEPLHVSSGCPWHEQEVAIVDPENRTLCREGVIGEVWLRGPNIAQGYWGRPDLTETTFRAYLADGRTGPYLRTGDLGFVRERDLVVVSRLKDLIIVRGQNYFPEDLEAAVEACHPELEPGLCAAFSVDDGREEGVVVLLELGKQLLGEIDLDRLAQTISDALTRQFEISIREFLILKKGTIPETSSGKIQRYRSRELYCAKALEPIKCFKLSGADRVEAETTIAEDIRWAIDQAQGDQRVELITSFLGNRLSQIRGEGPMADALLDHSIIRNGLDSIKVVEFRQAIETALGVDITFSELLDFGSLRSLAELIAVRIRPAARAAPTSDHVRRTDESRVSYGQRALLLDYERYPASAANNISLALRLELGIDRAGLTRAIAMLLERHDELTSVFTREGETFLRKTTPPKEEWISTFEAGGWSPSELKQKVDEAANLPFRLEEACIRFVLFEGLKEGSVLLLALHHILGDLRSIELLLQKLGENYDFITKGIPAPHTTGRPLIYSDFVAWQAEWLGSPAGQASLHYWQKTLSNHGPGASLPFEKKGSFHRAREGEVIHFSLSLAQTRALKSAAVAAEATPYMYLLAAYAAAIAVLAHEQEVVIGTSVTGRPTAEFAHTLGYFANILPLVLSVEENLSFAQLVRRVKGGVTSGLDHQNAPFSLLIEQLRERKKTDQVPLVRYAFTYGRSENSPLSLLSGNDERVHRLGGLRVRGYPLRRKAAPFDITLLILDQDEGLDISLSYDRSRYTGDAVATLAESFKTILTAAIQDSRATVSELAALGAKAEPPKMLCASPLILIHERFQRAAARWGDAVALSQGENHITYRQLNQRADRLASYLNGRGVERDRVVGIHLPPGPEVIVSMLAILKTGAAYLPLDPNYPEARLRFVLQDSQAGYIITTRERAGVWAGSDTLAFAWEEAVESISQPRESSLWKDVSPDSLAYILYTSGSTGNPKGVMVTHRNVARLFDSTHGLFEFQPRDVWTLYHSTSFDFSVWEIWGALTHGSRLVLVNYWDARSPEAMTRLIAQEEVTVFNQTPSAFYQLLGYVEGTKKMQELGSLRYIIFGGEKLSFDRLGGWFMHANQSEVRLVNMYGITETTVHVTHMELTAPIQAGDYDNLVGRPIDDLSVYLLDRHRRHVPRYALGEIAVGGEGVARGYWGRPGLTAEKFVPDPFARVAGSRMYLSGDAGFLLPDGRGIKYCHRFDRQVQVRGFRVETGEVEAQIRRIPGVVDAVVFERVNADETRLAACVVPAKGKTLEAATLRGQLSAGLPEYMIPSLIIIAPAIPITPHGKLDTDAVLALGLRESASDKSAVEPRGPLEILLHRVWSDVLELGNLGVEENFFTVGGDSIRAIQLVARAKKHGAELSVEDVFRFQTIRAQCEILESRGPLHLAAEGWLSREKSLNSNSVPGSGPAQDEQYPLSYLQQGLVFHESVGADFELYVTSFRIKGHYDRACLEQSIQNAAAVHPILRSAYDLNSEEIPRQIVYQSVSFSIEENDWTVLDAAAQKDRLEQWIVAQRNSPVDWSRVPLLRIAVHRTGLNEFVLSLVEPYLDGWSVSILGVELLNAYSLLLAGKNLPPPRTLKTTFRDYVSMERAVVASETQRAYWRSKGEAQVYSTIKKDIVRDTTMHMPVQRSRVTLSKKVHEASAMLAAQLGVSIKSVFLAAHLRVLGHVAGRRQITTGLLTNGRLEQEDGENVLGLFLNLVPFSIDLGRGTWIELIHRVQAEELEMLPFRRFPYLEIQKLNGHRRLFDVIFNFTQFHRLATLQKFHNLQLESIDASDQTYYGLTTHFNLDWMSENLVLALDYDAMLWNAREIEVLMQTYHVVLESLTSNPAGQYDLWPGRAAPGTRSGEEPGSPAITRDTPTVMELFEIQLRRVPDRVAVTSHDQQLTYRGLASRVEKLASHLVQAGVGPETVIGVAVSRNVDLVTTLLGILKAGGTYLPLDMGYPQERLEYMIADADARLIITERKFERKMSALARGGKGTIGSPVQHLYIEEFDFASEQILPEFRLLPNRQNLAYLIYTSGSTGKPKGVAISHENLCSLLSWASEHYRSEELARVFACTSICFDLSCFELFVPLSGGGTIDLGFDALALAANDHSSVTTLINTVPSALREILESSPGVIFGKVVNLAGEALSRELADRIYQLGRADKLYDLYGPSEDTTYTTCGLRRPGNPANIGRPFGAKRVYILDEFLQPVPDGTAGELYIAGPGLARGYLNRPVETARAWLPHPFESGGQRLYKTGDRGQWDLEGRIRFLGRADNQVKLRGFRIELDEIETALVSHSAVKEAAVVVVSEASGQPSLVAAVVADGDSMDEEQLFSGLREHLARRLPHYMLPSRFLAVGELPRTPNRKIDRHQIAALLPRETPIQAPLANDVIEDLVALEFARVLNIEAVDRQEDFFKLGGDSLLAMRIATRLNSAFGTKIPLRRLFELSSVNALAEYIRSQRRQDTERHDRGALVRGSGGQSSPLSYFQEAIWIDDKLSGEGSRYTLCTVLKVGRVTNAAALRQSLEFLVMRHDLLRSRFRYSKTGPLQEIAIDGAHHFARSDVSAIPEPQRSQSVQNILGREARYEFDLERESPWRVTLLQRGPQDYILAITMHHLVADDWSAKILLDELLLLYEALSEGKPTPFKPLNLRYSDFARWQRMEVSENRLSADRDYWKTKLAGMSGVEMFRRSPKRPVSTGGAREHFQIDSEGLAALKRLSRQQGSTLFITLLSAFKWMVHLKTGHREIVVGTSVMNRRPAELERIVGVFVNTVVLRTNLSKVSDVSELISEVRNGVLSTYDHREYPYSRLVQELNSGRGGKLRSLFQIVFGFWGDSWRNLSTERLDLEPCEIYNGQPKFPLEIQLVETRGTLKGYFEYDYGFFDHSEITEMIEAYRAMLTALAGGSTELPTGEILSGKERDPGSQIDGDKGEGGRVHPSEARELAL